MITSNITLLTSGVILTLLISATVISYTGKFIFGSQKLNTTTNQIYEPDLHISSICIFSKNAFTTPHDETPCFNKTLLLWYIPWLRQSLWMKFWNEIKTKNQPNQLKHLQTETGNETETVISNDTANPTDLPREKESANVNKTKKQTNDFVLSILFILVITSGLVAYWDVFKDKFKRNAAGLAKARERECTLADFTINRHLRRESQQQQTASHLTRQGSLEMTTKVTQNLIHQSSLDRAFPKTISEVTSQELRRNSVPMFLGSEIPPSTKRQSVDISREEINMDLRKKPRHFIRRH